MKSLTRGKFEFPHKVLSGAFVLTILLILLKPSTVMAQDLYFQFSGTNLSEALLSIAERTGSNIAFDAERLGHAIVDREISGENTSELLDTLLDGTEFNYLQQYVS